VKDQKDIQTYMDVLGNNISTSLFEIFEFQRRHSSYVSGKLLYVLLKKVFTSREIKESRYLNFSSLFERLMSFPFSSKEEEQIIDFLKSENKKLLFVFYMLRNRKLDAVLLSKELKDPQIASLVDNLLMTLTDVEKNLLNAPSSTLKTSLPSSLRNEWKNIKEKEFYQTYQTQFNISFSNIKKDQDSIHFETSVASLNVPFMPVPNCSRLKF
jgi:hypothetical protein